MTIPDDEDLEALKQRALGNPDRLAAFEEYVSLLSSYEEAIEMPHDADDLIRGQEALAGAKAHLEALPTIKPS